MDRSLRGRGWGEAAAVHNSGETLQAGRVGRPRAAGAPNLRSCERGAAAREEGRRPKGEAVSGGRRRGPAAGPTGGELHGGRAQLRRSRQRAARSAVNRRLRRQISGVVNVGRPHVRRGGGRKGRVRLAVGDGGGRRGRPGTARRPFTTPEKSAATGAERRESPVAEADLRSCERAVGRASPTRADGSAEGQRRATPGWVAR